MESNSELVDRLIQEALDEEHITCPECGSILETDTDVCGCGWKNPLVEMGLV